MLVGHASLSGTEDPSEQAWFSDLQMSIFDGAVCLQNQIFFLDFSVSSNKSERSKDSKLTASKKV